MWENEQIPSVWVCAACVLLLAVFVIWRWLRWGLRYQPTDTAKQLWANIFVRQGREVPAPKSKKPKCG